MLASKRDSTSARCPNPLDRREIGRRVCGFAGVCTLPPSHGGEHYAEDVKDHKERIPNVGKSGSASSLGEWMYGREALDSERSKVDFRMELGEQGESTVIKRVSRTGASPVEERLDCIGGWPCASLLEKVFGIPE